MRRALLGLTACALILGATVTVAGLAARADAGTIPLPGVIPCRNLARDPKVLSTPQLVVYRGVAGGYSSAHDWLCPREGGTAIGLGAKTISTAGFPAAERIGPIVSAGPWVAAFESSPQGWRDCAVPLPTHCPVHHHQVELTGLTAGSGSVAAGAHASALQVSSTRRSGGRLIGAVVWIEWVRGSQVLSSDVDTVRGSRNGRSFSVSGDRPVATGGIDPRSVRLVGLRVSFVQHGRKRAVRLRVG